MCVQRCERSGSGCRTDGHGCPQLQMPLRSSLVGGELSTVSNPFPPSVGRLGRQRVPCTARMTRQDGLGSPFLTRPLSCDHSQPLKAGRRRAPIGIADKALYQARDYPKKQDNQGAEAGGRQRPRPQAVEYVGPSGCDACRQRCKQTQARSNGPSVAFRCSIRRRKPHGHHRSRRRPCLHIEATPGFRLVLVQMAARHGALTRLQKPRSHITSFQVQATGSTIRCNTAKPSISALVPPTHAVL